MARPIASIAILVIGVLVAVGFYGGIAFVVVAAAKAAWSLF